MNTESGTFIFRTESMRKRPSFRNQIPLIIAKRDTYGEAIKFLEERLEGKEYLKVYNDDAYYLTDTK